MVDKRYNPEMLTIAREYNGLSQTALAKKTPYTQSIISRFESGDLPMSDGHIAVFSRALGFPPEFFENSARVFGLGPSFLFHRKRQTLGVGTLRRIEAAVNVTRLGVAKLLRGVEPEHRYSCTPREVGLDGTPEEIARLVRAEWDLPSGPINDLTGAIERAGAMVMRCQFPEKIDGVSLWASDTPPLIFLNASSSGDRDRWTLAHELGHLIMHRRVHESIEDEADRFASELLLPEKEIRRELSPMTLPRAAALKLKWRVSMAALIRRSRTLGLVTPNQYEYLWKQMGFNGWRTREPNQIPMEKAQNLQALIEFHRSENSYEVNQLAGLSSLGEAVFRAHFLPEDGPALRMVN